MSAGLLALVSALLPPADRVIARLADESFAVREQAQADLERLLLSPAGALYFPATWRGRHGADSEVRERCSKAMVRYADVRPEGWTVVPRIDMLPPDWSIFPRIDKLPKPYQGRAEVIKIFLGGVDEGGPGHPNDRDYREATWTLSADRMRKGVPRPCVIALIEAMAVRERAWRKERGLPEVPK